MYNKELKEKFINDETSSESTIRSYLYLFKIIEPYELNLNSDLCTIKKDKLEKILNEISGKKSSSLKTRYYMIKKYSQWCVLNNIEGACLDIELINVNVNSNKVKSTMVVNSKQLEMYLNNVFKPEKLNTIDNRYRVVFWLVFSGISEDDFINVKSDDIDLENMVIKFNDKKYPIYRESIESIKSCIELKKFRYIHPLYNIKTYKDRIDGNQIVRGFSEDTKQYIQNEISKKTRIYTAKNENNLRLTLKNTWCSGIFSRMYDNEIAGLSVDFFPLAKELIARNDGVLSEDETTRKKILSRANEIHRDYNSWKLSFGL